MKKNQAIWVENIKIELLFMRMLFLVVLRWFAIGIATTGISSVRVMRIVRVLEPTFLWLFGLHGSGCAMFFNMNTA
jgi:hypothetical protein